MKAPKCKDCANCKLTKVLTLIAECDKGCWVDPVTDVEFTVSYTNLERWHNLPYRQGTRREPLAARCIHFESLNEEDTEE